MIIKKAYLSAITKLKKAGISSAELDTRVLLQKAIEKDHSFLLSYPDMPLTNSQNTKFLKMLKRRLKSEPIAYILGHKEFYGLDFLVNKNVLIPRPESEELVQQALNRIKNYELRIKNKVSKTLIPNSEFLILDVGTGSGCLVISIAKEIEKLAHLPAYQLTSYKLFAADISQKALNIAKKNAKRLLDTLDVISTHPEPTGGWIEGGEKSYHRRIKFVHSDLFSNRLLHQKFNLIIANLPYVPKSIPPLAPPILGGENRISPPFQGGVRGGTSNNPIDFEPQNAIFADDNGAAIIKRFLTESQKYLSENGTILIELDPRNAKEILKFAQANFSRSMNYELRIKQIELKKDLAGLDRYLIISN